jgi:phenylalanyl-tRNA synthetase beta subunit
VGNNYEDFSKKINKKYITNLFNEAFPGEDFDFQLLNRDSLNSKIKNEIIISEVDIDDISNDVLKYEELVKPPSNFIKYVPISDLPCSKRDLSFSIKDIADCKSLELSLLNFKDNLLKEVFIFDHYINEEKNEIKMGFRFVFQSQECTITDKEVDNIMDNIVNTALEYASVSLPGSP